MTLNNLDLKIKISVAQIGLFFELIPVAICITNPEDGTFVYVNQNFETLYKVKRNKILNKKSTDLNVISIEVRKSIMIELDSKKSIENKKIVLTTFDGQKRNMIISVQKIKLEDKNYLITSTTDITEQIKTDLQLSSLNKELAFENNEKLDRADELEIANKELEHQNQLKELRTNELIAKNQQLLNAQRLGQIGSWDWDFLTNEIIWTDELHRIYGQKPQEKTITGDNFLMQIHPEDINYVNSCVLKSVETKKPFQF